MQFAGASLTVSGGVSKQSRFCMFQLFNEIQYTMQMICGASCPWSLSVPRQHRVSGASCRERRWFVLSVAAFLSSSSEIKKSKSGFFSRKKKSTIIKNAWPMHPARNPRERPRRTTRASDEGGGTRNTKKEEEHERSPHQCALERRRPCWARRSCTCRGMRSRLRPRRPVVAAVTLWVP